MEGTLAESGSGVFGEIQLSHLISTLSLSASAMKSYKNTVQLDGDEKDISEVAHELLLFVEKVVILLKDQRLGFEQSKGNLSATKAIDDYRRYNTPDNAEFEVLYRSVMRCCMVTRRVGVGILHALCAPIEYHCRCKKCSRLLDSPYVLTF